MKSILAILLLMSVPGWASLSGQTDKESMKLELRYVASVFKNAYAPADWKAKHVGWDIDGELQKGIDQIDQNKGLTIKDYHKIVARFFKSTQDYHVNFGFNLTEKARLPFYTKQAEGKYLIVWVDREKLPLETFPYKTGDEIIEFGGQPVADVVATVVKEIAMGVPETDAALGALYLTNRFASVAMEVPRGPIELKILPQGKKQVRSHQLIWHYTPEDVIFPDLTSISTPQLTSLRSSGDKQNLLINQQKSAQMVWTNHELFSLEPEDQVNDTEKKKKPINPYRIGAKKSFVPKLGLTIWESDEEKLFHSYLYKNKKGKLIGYVRIPSYGGGLKKFEEFRDTIKRFSDTADALVIDQINNPGGSLFYIYALQSVLSDQVMYAPKQHLKIDPGTVKEAAELLEKLNKITTSEEAQELIGKEWGGYPITYQSAEFLKEFCRFVLDEWKLGNTFTKPTFLWGVDKINPHKEVHFTKPIVVLTNELDFSGGDFFPAILQDNKRATILGVRTAGAGGFVRMLNLPSQLGLSDISYTGSLAKRVNDQPIENLGVTPDIEYKLTVEDYRQGFAGYKKAINKAINDLLKK